MIPNPITAWMGLVLIFDEFHERSLQADLALALSFVGAAVLRDDLRTVGVRHIDSAYRHPLGMPVITSSGRHFR